MRLIDADEYIEKWADHFSALFGKDVKREILISLSNMPTAFDKEKVIEELDYYLFEKYCIEEDDGLDVIIDEGGIYDK